MVAHLRVPSVNARSRKPVLGCTSSQTIKRNVNSLSVMNSQLLQQALQDLPDGQPSVSQVHALGQLVDGDLPLQTFLEQLLPQLCELFSAPAAVAWMKAAGANDAVFGVRYRMDPLLATATEQKKHERLVQLAWQQKQPLLAEPGTKGTRAAASTSTTAANKDRANQGDANNTTGHRLLFAPILHCGEPIALLEIVLSMHTGTLTSSQRQLYLRSVQLVAERVYGGLRRRMTMPAATLSQATQQLTQLSDEVQQFQQQILRSIEARLAQFHGWTFGSLSENQEFAKMVHQLLDSHGLRVECPECGHPAILRCLRAGNAKHGAFVFDHYLDTGRTFHGGPTTVPLLKVVGKPARRPALSNSD